MSFFEMNAQDQQTSDEINQPESAEGSVDQMDAQSESESASSDSSENEGKNPGQRPHITPRMVVQDTINIDWIREQLENHGRTLLLRSEGVFVPERSISLLVRALRVPRVPRSNGPTHFSIPRHVDRSGTLLPVTEQWDSVNWRTRATKPLNTHAILLARAALRILPEEGLLKWEDIETHLKSAGANGVYEPLSVAMVPQGDVNLPKLALAGQTAHKESGGKKGSRLLDMAASVFRGASKGAATPLTSEEAKAQWLEKLQAAGLHAEAQYIVVSPFGRPEDGTHDWSVERCAEVLRHTLEWRKMQSIILCFGEDKGKAERLRIISGQNVATIFTDLSQDLVMAAIAGSKGVLAVPGQLIQLAHQLSTPSVCVAGSHGQFQPGTAPHLLVKPHLDSAEEIKCLFCKNGEHSCPDDLEAGPVARALSKVLTVASA